MDLVTLFCVTLLSCATLHYTVILRTPIYREFWCKVMSRCTPTWLKLSIRRQRFINIPPPPPPRPLTLNTFPGWRLYMRRSKVHATVTNDVITDEISQIHEITPASWPNNGSRERLGESLDYTLKHSISFVRTKLQMMFANNLRCHYFLFCLLKRFPKS